MSIRPTGPSIQHSLARSSGPEPLKAESSKTAEAPMAGKTAPPSDTQTTAKAPGTPAAGPSSAVGAFQASSIDRVARRAAGVNPLAGKSAAAIAEALQGAKADNPQTTPGGGPRPDLPEVSRPVVGGGPPKAPAAPGGPRFDQATGTLVQAGGVQSLVSADAPSSAVRDLAAALTDRTGGRKGFDQGFGQPPTVGADVVQRLDPGNGGLTGLVSESIGGVLGQAAASDVRGLPDRRGLVADGKSDPPASGPAPGPNEPSNSGSGGGKLSEADKELLEAGDRGGIDGDSKEMLKPFRELEQVVKALEKELYNKQPQGGAPLPGPMQPVPEGEGRQPDRLNLVGGSPVLQSQRAAREAGRRGSEVTPAPEDASAPGGAVAPGSGGRMRDLVGNPGGPRAEGGAPRAGTDFGGSGGAIDPGRDAVIDPAGGREQHPGDFFGASDANRDLPGRAVGGSGQGGSSGGSPASGGTGTANSGTSKASLLSRSADAKKS